MTYSYAHMCRDDHQQIGHNDSEHELCPLCRANNEIERLRDALQNVVSWSQAYPLKVFPEPDWKKARDLLAAGGMTLDSVSASNMRHVLTGIAGVAAAALSDQQDENGRN